MRRSVGCGAPQQERKQEQLGQQLEQQKQHHHNHQERSTQGYFCRSHQFHNDQFHQNQHRHTRSSGGGFFMLMLLICGCFFPSGVDGFSIVENTAKTVGHLTGYIFPSIPTRILIPPKHPGLQVIGAGYGKTGTKSIEDALLILLGGDVYDMRALLKHGHEDRWIKALNEWDQEKSLEELTSIVQDIESLGYSITLDFPISLFAEPLSLVRPNAKVLLSTRDNVEKWYKSWKVFIRMTHHFIVCLPWSLVFPAQFQNVALVFYRIMGKVQLEPYQYPDNIRRLLPWFEVITEYDVDNKTIEEQWKQSYLANIDRITEIIDKERLLIYNVKQGWDPLIDWLGVVEDASSIRAQLGPFPHVNDKSTVDFLCKLSHVAGIMMPFLVLSGFYVMYRTWKSIIVSVSILLTKLLSAVVKPKVE